MTLAAYQSRVLENVLLAGRPSPDVRVDLVAMWPRRENLGLSSSLGLPAFVYSWPKSLLLWWLSVILLIHLQLWFACLKHEEKARRVRATEARRQ